MNGWLVVGAFAGTIAAIGAAVWVGRRLQKGETAKAVEEARQRMDAVAGGTKSGVTNRMRNGSF